MSSFIIDKPTEIVIHTTLQMDKLYYDAALSALKNADDLISSIISAQANIKQLKARERSVIEKYNNDYHKAYDELEPIAIQMDDAHSKLSYSFGEHIKWVAATHIFCVCALESYINMLSKEVLDKTTFEIVDRLPLADKYIMLPKLQNCLALETNNEPFQSLRKLIKIRNKLVHYKPHTEEWKMLEVPSYVEELHLTVDEARRSIATVPNAIMAISKSINRKKPDWITPSGKVISSSDYFSFEVKQG